jgi:1-phosphatidylinositol phosphodiesterase
VAQDVSFPIGPFEGKTTDVSISNNEIVRLTFETEGQRYRVDIPSSQQRSTLLTPLSPDPRFEYTAVHLSKSSHLSLFSSANLASWMGKLKDESPLSSLSIPGTHNAPTCYVALPSVRCQAVSVREQLNNGVRFLDIRVQPHTPEDPADDRLILVHSAFPISLTGNKYFRDLLSEITSFLDENPSETVIISLKREGVGKATDEQLSKILKDHYTGDANRWFTEPRIPTLGEARKKIVVLRRFHIDGSIRAENPGGWCIDGESWPDNCEDGLCSSGDIRVQDFYEVEESVNIEKKITFSEAQLARAAAFVSALPEGGQDASAAAAAKRPFFINFLSASNFFRPNCWPDKIAAKINPRVVEFLCRRHNDANTDGIEDVGDGSTGIVVCDWVGNDGDWDLVRCIVGHNAKLEIRQRSE